MDWLKFLQAVWPIAATITPLIMLAGFYWLKTQFASNGDFTTLVEKVGNIEKSITEKVGSIEQKLAVVERDSESAPTRAELSQGLSIVSGRISGVEAAVKGLSDTSKTQHDYLRTLLESALNGGRK